MERLVEPLSLSEEATLVEHRQNAADDVLVDGPDALVEVGRMAPKTGRGPKKTVTKRSERGDGTVGSASPPPPVAYDREAILDAPEYYGYASAFGTLTWGTWDDEPRPVSLRIADFVAAYSPEDPGRFTGGSGVRDKSGSYLPGTRQSRLERFIATDGRGGSLHEMLARYGLRLRDAPPLPARPFVPSPLRDTARKRNHKLRVLYGGVDIEAANMDEKKAAYLDSQEKQLAARQVREALRRMRHEHTDASDGEAEPEES